MSVGVIAQTLAAHQWWFVGNLSVPGMPDSRDYKCSCGWTAGGGIGVGEDPHTHVAEAVIAALELQQEWTWSWPNGSAQGVPGYGYSVPTREEAEEEGPGYDIVSRVVTPWAVGVGEQPQ